MEGIFLSKQDQFAFRQISEFIAGKISRNEAARLLNKSERSISRLAAEIEKKGLAGVTHGNRGKTPSNKIAADLKTKVMSLVHDKYYDFNMLHCLEILKSRHKLEVNRETFRKWCHEKQLVKKKKRRRSIARHYRVRMPAEGYLLQMDGSPHLYNGKQTWSLILTIDDATSEIPYARFFPYETTDACLQVMREIILRKGIPRAIYTDKAGWAGGGKRIEFSQFHRACEELGIQVLYANSPQAKGRVERSFNTIQDRLIPELRINKIHSMEQANKYLMESFIPNYWNKRNALAPRSNQSEYRVLKSRALLDEIFCHKKNRTVAPNNCISIYSDIFQLRHPDGRSLVRKRVEVRRYDQKRFGVFFENIKLDCKLVHKHKPRQKTWEEHVALLEKYD